MNMTQKIISSVAMLLAPLTALHAAESWPNILYIFTDDNSVRTLGCYADSPDQPLIQMHTGGKLYGDADIADALKKARKSGDWSRLIAESKTGIRSWLMLREGKYKYVRYLYADYIEELYDLEADPFELTNLALRKANHEQLATLRAKLLTAFAARGATYLDLLPAPKILDEPPTATAAPEQSSTMKKKKGKK